MTQEQIIDAVEKMTVLELNTLVKAIEEKWGVSATAVAAAGPAAAAADEKTSFAVELTGAGDQKVAVIKVVKEALALGLAEAKAFVDGAPKILKEDMKKEDAEALKTLAEKVNAPLLGRVCIWSSLDQTNLAIFSLQRFLSFSLFSAFCLAPMRMLWVTVSKLFSHAST